MAPLRRWLSSHAKDRDDRACPAEDKSAPSDHKPVPLDDPVRLLDDMSKEYYAIVEVVSGFDQRLMTIKGWSVTLSLAALGLGFQQGHYALFALAAATAGGFWYVDPLNKRLSDEVLRAHARHRGCSPRAEPCQYRAQEKTRDLPRDVPRRTTQVVGILDKAPLARGRARARKHPHVGAPNRLELGIQWRPGLR
jgi:hypothetical protein